MIIETAGILKYLLIISNRLASWIGSGYFFRKGIKHKKKRFYALSVFISIIMLWILFFIIKN